MNQAVFLYGQDGTMWTMPLAGELPVQFVPEGPDKLLHKMMRCVVRGPINRGTLHLRFRGRSRQVGYEIPCIPLDSDYLVVLNGGDFLADVEGISFVPAHAVVQAGETFVDVDNKHSREFEQLQKQAATGRWFDEVFLPALMPGSIAPTPNNVTKESKLHLVEASTWDAHTKLHRDAWQERSRLADAAGAQFNENKLLLQENAKLRRALEDLERKLKARR